MVGRYLGRGVGGLALALMTISCGGGERLAAPSAPPAAQPAATATVPPATATSAPRPTLQPTAQPTGQPTAPPTATTAPTSAPRPAAPTPRPLTELDQAVQAAQADLAGRLGVSAQAVQVAEAAEVEWPNLAMGCPEPGMMYGQVIVPGFRVVLQAGGQLYQYHGDRKGTMKLCQTGQPEAAATQAPDRGAGGGGPMDAKLADQIALAKADLQSRVKTLKAEDIHVVSAAEVTWNDGSLGCPEPGMMYTMALVPGYRIVLESGGVQYDYHGGRSGKPRLCQQPTGGRFRGGPGDITPLPPSDPTK